ncbi:MAG: class I tRNA ligase family protein [Pseudomonadota bacterium]
MLDKYNFVIIEKWVRNKWEINNFYDAKFDKKNSRLFDGPPPHISGDLHLGHVFSYSHHAIYVSYYRQRGIDLFYCLGFDNNGIPTEKFTEKENKISSSAVKRSEFLNLCRATITKYRPRYLDLFIRLGIIFNKSNIYDTLNVESLVWKSFERLKAKKEVYQSYGPVLWDIAFQTAISQSELEDKEQETQMNYIKFSATSVKDKDKLIAYQHQYTKKGFTDEVDKSLLNDMKIVNFDSRDELLNYVTIEDNIEITIATTRPELLPACSAVFYHPDDDRFNKLNIKYILLPILNRLVPFLPDKDVKQDKGTGLVMCCTFGDMQDIEWWKKHNLDLLIMLNKFGKVEFSEIFGIDKEHVFSALKGLSVINARKEILNIMHDYIVKQELFINRVKVSERSKKPVEFIVTKQWFVHVLRHKEQLYKLADKIEWYPAYMKGKYLAWIETVSWDWCISRQRVLGITIPGSDDVFDTWFTSAITNLIIRQAVEKSDVFDDDYIPSYIRGQAHEIIRTWTFYSILIHYLHFQDIPWKKIVVSGWCLAEDNSKMSKSKGNVMCPEFVLNQYGVDSIRYWASNGKLGNDFRYSEQIIKHGKRVINKLWNTVKLLKIVVFKTELRMFNEEFDGLELMASIDKTYKNNQLYDIDLWILYKFQLMHHKYDQAFKEMDYFTARLLLEEFFISIFCDFYLEIVKDRLYNDGVKDSIGQLSAQITFYIIVRKSLTLWAPFLPYVTEYLYQFFIMNSDDSIIHINKIDNLLHFKNIEVGDVLIQIIELVRKYKSDMNIALNQEIKSIVIDMKYKELFSDNSKLDLQNVINCKMILFEDLQQQGIKSSGDISDSNEDILKDESNDFKYMNNDQGFIIKIFNFNNIK